MHTGSRRYSHRPNANACRCLLKIVQGFCPVSGANAGKATGFVSFVQAGLEPAATAPLLAGATWLCVDKGIGSVIKTAGDRLGGHLSQKGADKRRSELRRGSTGNAHARKTRRPCARASQQSD